MSQKRPRRRKGNVWGFTLTEVLIVLVIVALLATVALPSYRGTLAKSRRTDATAMLTRAALRQEQFLLERSTYTDDPGDLGYPADAAVSERGYYRLGVVAQPCGDIRRCYALTATAIPGGPQGSDRACATFRLDSTGLRSATDAAGSPSERCW